MHHFFDFIGIKHFKAVRVRKLLEGANLGMHMAYQAFWIIVGQGVRGVHSDLQRTRNESCHNRIGKIAWGYDSGHFTGTAVSHLSTLLKD